MFRSSAGVCRSAVVGRRDHWARDEGDGLIIKFEAVVNPAVASCSGAGVCDDAGSQGVAVRMEKTS
jgi:hypothetical protein